MKINGEMKGYHSLRGGRTGGEDGDGGSDVFMCVYCIVFIRFSCHVLPDDIPKLSFYVSLKLEKI